MKIPDIWRFRQCVDAVPSQRNSVLVKVLYLSAARVSEIVSRVTPFDKEKALSRPYGQYLEFSVGDYEAEKVLLLKIAIAQRRETRPNHKPPFRMVALPTLPKYEPWTYDLLMWIRDSVHHQLSFNLTRNRVYTIIRKQLRTLDPHVSPSSLRQWRIHHLLSVYGFTPYDIALYAGYKFRTGFSQRLMSNDRVDILLSHQWKTYFPKLLKPIS
jgi:hypothetical protein